MPPEKNNPDQEQDIDMPSGPELGVNPDACIERLKKLRIENWPV